MRKKRDGRGDKRERGAALCVPRAGEQNIQLLGREGGQPLNAKDRREARTEGMYLRLDALA